MRVRSCWVLPFLIVVANFVSAQKLLRSRRNCAVWYPLTTTTAPSVRSGFPKTMGPGCAFIDYDNDGLADILLINGKTGPATRRAAPPRRSSITTITTALSPM